MKKWLTGLLSGSSVPKDEKKKGQKEMSKAKPVKSAAKAVKPAAKTKPEAKAKTAAKAKTPTPAAAPKAAKTKVEPVEAKVAAPAEEAPASKNKGDKKPKKGASTEANTASSTTGLADTASPENKKKWRELREKFGKEKAASYSMTAQYEADQPIEHKVLGWGYIMTNNNDRLEVLFETGIKILISNYRA